MEYKTHRYGGMCAGAIASSYIYGIKYLNYFNPQAFNTEAVIGTAVLIASGAIGSLIPDIDHSNSRISRDNRLLSIITQLFLGISRAITSIILFFCFWISKRRKNEILSGMEHRGIFHTLLMTFAIYLLFGFICQFIPFYGKLIQIGVTVGYLSHILVDMLTKGGVMLFYPIITYKFHYPFIRLTTGKHEIIAAIIITLVTITSIFLLNI